MILLIDNYDSFTYNVYQYVGSINSDVKVVRNDKITMNEIVELNPEKIIISPGPGTPDDSGISIDIIKEFGQQIPILGICLGHQCIGQAFGATVSHAKELYHGKYSMIVPKNDSILFKDMSSPFKAARYHSLAIIESTIPDCLKVTAMADDGEIMAIEHKEYPIYGLQFHPESIYTPEGMMLIKNFLDVKSSVTILERKTDSKKSVVTTLTVNGGKYMIKNELLKVIDGIDLTSDEMTNVMDAIMSGDVTEIEISAFLTALKIKGETVEEISSAAKVMRNKATKVNLSEFYTIDTCGTGGDSSGTYNISTAVAFLAAADGVKVVKHGNRSISSKCGSADVLEKLGINITLSPKETRECVKDVGIGFFFAPLYHSAMKHVMGVRRTLGYRTIFNILGPLSNPASANGQVVGVFSESLVEPMARVLNNLGVERALVVHGRDGLDEITVTDSTFVAEVKDGKVLTYEIKPEDFGLSRSSLEDIKGGTAEANAQIIKDLLSGKLQGAMLDILLINAGGAFFTAKRAETIGEGIKIAKSIIESGSALDVINQMVQFTNKG